MHVTSDHYRQRGANRIELSATGPLQSEQSPRLPLTHPRKPLRPSTETLRRLARLHLAQSYSKHVA